MSESNQASSSQKRQRAARNPYSQTSINETLAVFLAERNLPVPACLKRPAEGDGCRSRSKKLSRRVEQDNRQDVCSRFLFS